MKPLKWFTTSAALALLCAVGNVNADLVIDVIGNPGSGVTKWTFITVAPGVAELDGSVRDNSANTFNGADTGQFPFGQDTILNTGYQDVVFTLTGNASITIAGNTEALTGIFLDDDGGSADDIGVRVANELAFLQNDLVTWTGSGMVNVDITDFVAGSWDVSDVGGQRLFISEFLTVNFTAVPEPTSAAFAGLMVLGLVSRRRRG